MKYIKQIAAMFTCIMLVNIMCSCEKEENNVFSGISGEYYEKINTTITDYIESLENCDYKTYCSYQTTFYNDAYENYAISNGFENGEEFFVENEYGYYKSTLGNNFKINVTIDNITVMTENELNSGENAIVSTFGVDNIEITQGFEVTVTEDAIGNKGNEKESYEIMLIEIEKELYVYNQYFEYLSSAGYWLWRKSFVLF